MKMDPLPAFAETSPVPQATPQAGELVADIVLLAERWYGVTPGEPLSAGAELPSPEALTALAADRGIDLRFSERSLASLSREDFPCIVLERGGGSRILVGPDGDGFEALGRDGLYRIPGAALAAGGDLLVFFVAPTLPGEAAHQVPPPSHDPEARQARRTLLRRIVTDILLNHRGLLAQLALASLLGNVLLLGYPIFSMAVYDRVVPHLAFDTLWALAIGVMLALAADLAMRSVRLRIGDTIAASVASSLQAQLFARLLRLPMAKVPRTAANISAGIREIEGLCQTAPNIFVTLGVDLPFLIVVIALLGGTGGYVVLVPVGAAVLVALVYVVAHGGGEKAMRERGGAVRAQTNLLNETIDCFESVKASLGEHQLMRRFERLNEASVRAGHESRLWSSAAGLFGASVGQAAMVATLVVGVYEIAAGSLTVGGLVFCTMLVGRMMAPVTQLVGLLHQVKLASGSMEGVAALLTAPLESAGDPGRAVEAAPLGRIDLRHVSFSYEGADSPTLSDVTLTIRPGEKVGIIGRIGSGKSTLLRLLVRIYAPTSGAVLLDGFNIGQMSPRLLRRTLAFMGQSAALLDETLRANLLMGHDVVDPARFEKAVEIAGVRDIAARSKEGYSLRVGPRGERLSGGERQAVALARALIGDPRVLILDEPTAAMDNALEAKIVRDLKAWLGERTLVVATHRAPLLALVDRVIWIEGGRVVADGPKADILKRISQAA